MSDVRGRTTNRKQDNNTSERQPSELALLLLLSTLDLFFFFFLDLSLPRKFATSKAIPAFPSSPTP